LIRGWSSTDPIGSPYYDSTPYGSDIQLFSLASPYVWGSGILKAHKTPAKGITNAGFFGFYQWDYAMEELRNVSILGTYIGWGRTVVGEKGMRTEYAKLEYLTFNPNRGYDANFINRLQKLADTLKVPLVTFEGLQEFKTGMVPLDQTRIDSWKEDN